ncbi:unnamed protein product [Effrenium voratum]|nr:unnamed protein product [Effrenium voratum]
MAAIDQSRAELGFYQSHDLGAPARSRTSQTRQELQKQQQQLEAFAARGSELQQALGEVREDLTIETKGCIEAACSKVAQECRAMLAEELAAARRDTEELAAELKSKTERDIAAQDALKRLEDLSQATECKVEALGQTIQKMPDPTEALNAQLANVSAAQQAAADARTLARSQEGGVNFTWANFLSAAPVGVAESHAKTASEAQELAGRAAALAEEHSGDTQQTAARVGAQAAAAEGHVQSAQKALEAATAAASAAESNMQSAQKAMETTTAAAPWRVGSAEAAAEQAQGAAGSAHAAARGPVRPDGRGLLEVEATENHAGAARNALAAVQTNADTVREKVAQVEHHAASVKDAAAQMAEQASALQETSSQVALASDRAASALGSEAERHLAAMAAMAASVSSFQEKLRETEPGVMGVFPRLLGLLLSAAAAAAADADEEAFHVWAQSHGRSYSPESYRQRLELFQLHAQQVAALNALPERRWTAGLGPLADFTEEELQNLRGWRGTASSAGASPLAALQVEEDLPEQVNWTSLSSLQHIADQGSCGSCWAVTSTTVLAAHAELVEAPRSFSTQELVDCVPNPRACGGTGGCAGATVELAMSYVMHLGLGSAAEWPYRAKAAALCGKLAASPAAALQMDGHTEELEVLDAENQSAAQLREDLAALKTLHQQQDLAAEGTRLAAFDSAGRSFGMAGWQKLPQNGYAALLQAVYHHGPVGVSVAAGTWHLYSSGIFDYCGKDAVIDHAVTLVGFGRGQGKSGSDKYWLVQNSWGPHWGEGGRIRLLRRDSEGEHCGWDRQPQKGTACKGDPAQVRVCGMCGILYDSVVPHFTK